MNRWLPHIILSLTLWAHCSPAMPFLPGGPIEVRTEIVWNPIGGSETSACTNTRVIERGLQNHWWVAISDAPDRAPLTCGLDSDGGAGSNPVGCDETALLCFIAKGTTTASVRVQMENERVVVANMTASLLGQSGHEEEIRREFNFAENREIYVPIFSADERLRRVHGIGEVYLKISVMERLEPSRQVYGEIWFHSSREGTGVILNGGHIGAIPESGDMILRNVPAGLHTLEIVDTDSQPSGKVVRVFPNRRVYADLDNTAGDMPEGRLRLVPTGPNQHGYQEFRRATDDAIVVQVPEGEFLMGNEDTERSPTEHTVYVSTFYMDKTGVTWGQYKQFLDSSGIPLPPHDPYWGIHDDQPAVFVTWEEAKNYCEWAGGRLPTEAEREKAARGTDERKYPWGNQEPTPELGVFRKSWGYEGPAPVGQHPKGASPYGLLDMGGNVWEWCADWYDGAYYERSPYSNPKGPASGTAHVVRGGSWDSRPTVLSSSCRSWGHIGYRDGDFGFRCAMNSPR